MKAATISELKRELKDLPANELLEVTLRLARFKKDNKELLTYLLFESANEQAFIEQAKQDMEWEFEEVNTDSVYFAKKTLRKILRNLKKQIKYSGQKRTEVELLLHFCKLLKSFEIPYHDYTTLLNMYEGQLNLARKAIEKLHEDLQYDYNEQIRTL